MIKVLEIERKLSNEGYRYVIGADEAGRGALAGPLCAAAVLIDLNDSSMIPARDSKTTKHSQRLEVCKEILRRAMDVSVVCFSPERIDREGIHSSNISALRDVVDKLLKKNSKIKCGVLVDHYAIKGREWLSVTYGDSLSVAIACASIVAKVYRDQVMSELEEEYPEYSFRSHKGYGTASHLAEISKNGPSKVHRSSFKGVLDIRLFDG